MRFPQEEQEAIRMVRYAIDHGVNYLDTAYAFGYALGWMSQQRTERLRQRLLSDVHAPAKWRVLGPMSNIPEFYQAFGVKPGQPMWRAPQDRVRIW
jgi:putative endopeptidase